MHKWRLLPLSSIVGLLLYFCSCGGSHQTAKGKLPFGVADAPRNGETFHGSVELRGWALSDTAAIDKVSVYLDRVFVMAATINQQRPDVAKAYPSIANSQQSGWSARLGTEAFTPGVHELVVQATDANGMTRELTSIGVTFVKP